jgi:hypothetical protein
MERRVELETDEKGIVTFLPLITWGVSIVQGKTVGLAMDYYASAEDVAAQRLSRLQVHLDVQGAKDMGRVLQEHSDRLRASGGGAPGQ